jgi:hypothetical protein
MSNDDFRRILLDLRVAFDDADAVTEDMLLDPLDRELGPKLHRKQYREARRKIRSTLDYLMRLTGDGTPPEGGTPPTH